MGDLRRLYESGLTVRQVAERAGMSYDAARNRLAAMEVLRGPGGSKRGATAALRADIRRAAAMYDRGMSPAQIGRCYGISDDTVRRVLAPLYGQRVAGARPLTTSKPSADPGAPR